MGQTAADTQREITALRQEVTDAASELDRRVTEMLDVRARMADATDWALRMIDEQPKAVAGASAAMALGVALLGARAIGGRKKKRSAAARLAATRDAAREEAVRRIEEALGQARELLGPAALTTSAFAASLGKPATKTNSEPSMLKKLLWTALTAGSLALAGLAARKLSTSLWQAVMHEEPPTASA